MVLFAIGVIFVLAVFVAVLGRLIRNRREISTVTCPENHRRALVVLHRSPDGAGYDAVAHCSLWHDGQVDCGQRCLGIDSPARMSSRQRSRVPSIVPNASRRSRQPGTEKWMWSPIG